MAYLFYLHTERGERSGAGQRGFERDREEWKRRAKKKMRKKTKKKIKKAEGERKMGLPRPGGAMQCVHPEHERPFRVVFWVFIHKSSSL